MIKGFSDYQVYVIESDEIQFSDHLLICLEDNLDSESEKKMYQILNSVDQSADKTIIQNKTESEMDYYYNVMEEKKVLKCLVFVSNVPKGATYYTPLQSDSKEIIFSHPISRLIQDEKEGIKERRMALWKNLKAWK